MSDNITIKMHDGFNYLRSEEGIWAIQYGEKGLEIVTDPETVAEDFERYLSVCGLIRGKERDIMMALVAELKLVTILYKDLQYVRAQLNLTQEENRSLYAYNRDFR